MHLDTVFSLCDRDLCTIFREVVNQIAADRTTPTGDDGTSEGPGRSGGRCSTVVPRRACG